MSVQMFMQLLENEISPKDIVNFLIESWKSILIAGLLGVLAAGGYFVASPKIYEATVPLQLAKIKVNSNFFGVHLEEPSQLILRMKYPSSYDNASISACGFEGAKQPSEQLAKMVKLSLIKDSQLIELRVFGLSQSQAINCAEAVYAVIKESQKLVAEPILNDANIRLGKAAAKLQQLREFIGGINELNRKDSVGLGAYLSARDEARTLNDEVMHLTEMIAFDPRNQIKKFAPIYSSGSVISPKRNTLLFLGLMGGFLLGLLLNIGLRLYRYCKVTKR